MKRRLFVGLLLLALAVRPAYANSWGLKGELLTLVMHDNRWSDYSAVGRQQVSFAVLGARYHNVLTQSRDGELLTYPLAVYQPDDGRDDELCLTLDGQELTISYGADESYVFELQKQLDAFRFEDTLVRARVGSLFFERQQSGYLISEGSQTAVWQRTVTLSDFNIRLFPRALAQIKQLNHLCAALDSGLASITPGVSSVGIGKGTVAVYSAPDENAWRAAKGKAAVGLSGQLWRMGDYFDENGVAFTKIRYEVSKRTQRIGYVRTSDLNAVPGDDQTSQLICTMLQAAVDTYLTDDPLCSQYRQLEVPSGTALTCLEVYGQDYAYVSARVKDGRLGADGQIVWGYVPLRDLCFSPNDPFRSQVEWDVMASYAGQWHYTAGGQMSHDRLLLYADGTYESAADGSAGGTWRLTRYNPNDGLYWVDTPYEITFLDDQGRVNVKGFLPTESGFSLINWEGSGGYERMEEDG